MTTPAAPVPPGTPVTTQTVAAPEKPAEEIRIYSHNYLFYWWPVWVFGLAFAFITYTDGSRLAIVDPSSRVIVQKDDQGKESATLDVKGPTNWLIRETYKVDGKANGKGEELQPRVRVSARAWMGPVFCFLILLVIAITNIPLRGLWSLVVIISMVVVVLALSLLELWDSVLSSLGNVHVYINMAGYLVIGTVLMGMWFISVLVFDHRMYVIFTPGQVRVCEEIGGREQVYDTTSISIEKRRDDWFRHIILGFGTGDLTVKVAGASPRTIEMHNVVLIGSKIDAVERMTRSRSTKPSA